MFDQIIALASAIVRSDISYMVDYIGLDFGDVKDVKTILTPNEFHQLCNTVRQYDVLSQRAAFIAYSRRYVDARLTTERVAAYKANVQRPHFGDVFVNSPARRVANVLSPADVQALVANLRNKAYTK